MALAYLENSAFADFLKIVSANNLDEIRVILENNLQRFGISHFCASELPDCVESVGCIFFHNLRESDHEVWGEFARLIEGLNTMTECSSNCVKWEGADLYNIRKILSRICCDNVDGFVDLAGVTAFTRISTGSKLCFSIVRTRRPDIDDRDVFLNQYLAYAIAERLGEFTRRRLCISMQKTLTPRQILCAGFMSQGFSDQQIAEELNISSETVKEHISTARLRIGARRRTELVYKLTKAGLIA